MPRTLFQMGFQGSTFRPLSPTISLRRRMGQDDWESWGTDETPTGDPLGDNPDPLTPADEEPGGVPGIITSPDQGGPSEGAPGVITSPDQGGPAEPVPGIVTGLPKPPVIPTKQPPGMSDTDYAKLLVEGLKLGVGYYTQEQLAKMKAEADRLKAKSPAAAAILSGGTSVGTYLLIGAGAVSLVALIAILKK